MKIPKLTAAYLSGLVDGEGYIGILRIKKGNKKDWFSNREFIFIPVLKIVMTDRSTIEWLHKSFGGTFEVRKAHDRAKESYGWMCRKHIVRDIIKFIHPYMRTKKKQADLILRFPQSPAGHPLTDEVYNKRTLLREEIRLLNKRGAA